MGVIIFADARADFDGDGNVDFSNCFGFAGSFGKPDPIYDVDASELVDFTDFLVFAESFGRPLNWFGIH